MGCDRSRRPRGTIARGPGGDDFGVAFVEPGDGLAQAVAAEDLGAPASSVRVDFDQHDPLSRVGADVELRAREPTRRKRLPAEREGVTQGREYLGPVCQV